MNEEEIWDDTTNSYIKVGKKIKKNFWEFSKQEKIDLIISWLTLSIAFSLVLINFDLISAISGSTNFLSPLIAFPIALIAVGTGFVFHELAHRQAARHFGFVSEYRAWYPMLAIAVIMAVLTGWILAAPGATYFFGRNVTRRQDGIISIAGPITNIVLGVFLTILAMFTPNALFITILISCARINFFFALFNLMPIWVLDGKKVLAWNPLAWALAITIPLIATLVPGLFFGFFI
ncbi:MAG: site-2 protease family protein [Candidatus ainarchaeum sp.]|nr:site-2 protease family protein [Candidatus ainarchaeum sp.]